MKIIRNHTHCKKCNIKLCEKNEWLSWGGSGFKNGYKYRHTTCRQCVRKNTTCQVRYESTELNELCKKQAVIIYNRIYGLNNREAINKNGNKSKAIRVENLTDSIVVDRIVESHAIKKLLGRKLTREEVTPTMIDLQRKMTLTRRNLNK